MEEYKNLHEIIQLSEEEFENPDVGVHATLDKADLRELRNLLAKNEEQEKMIELMAKHMEAYMPIYSIFKKLNKEDWIEFFRKKAKGE